ncbi:hypothetical protein [Sphingobacterium sp. BIGb0116]|uniref:hypothetical protein n=1 Tax=Sphingobacterium sp. BIGb0116 TaxID=2940619 RepID=UPI00216951DE|nr:hypothetical protein [Sphingobacterium sp. BIGb0116]MCS4168519.1 hypothetical protein [Sphingobacterium sp. BIGb0116]
MEFQIDYASKDRIMALGEKIKYLSSKNNIYHEHINTNIKRENLRYNLSYILSHIILNLKYIDRSKGEFENIIVEFNLINDSTITIKDFEEISWIRLISGEVVLPVVVKHFIWKVGYSEAEGKGLDLPAGKENLVNCLRMYYDRYFKDAKLTIARSVLDSILKSYAPREISTEFLTGKKILEEDTNKGELYWTDHNYLKSLKNEIAATLWILISEDNTFEEFQHYAKLLIRMKMYGVDMTDFLAPAEYDQISKFAVEYLTREEDLLKSEHDFQKIWLDALNYHHIEIDGKIPNISFDYSSTYNFINSVVNAGRQHDDLFFYQRTRVFSSLLLGLYLKNLSSQQKQYSEVPKILKDLSRPFLLWILYNDIAENFAYVLPYLLNESELIPSVLRLIDKIPVDEVFLKKQEYWHEKNEEKYKITNELFFESFDLILDLFSNLQYESNSKGDCIVKILIDTAKNVFSYKGNNNYVRHHAAKKRYDQILQLLTFKRYSGTNNGHNISPRMIISMLPEMLDYLLYEYKSPDSRHHYLSLDRCFLDVSVEVLRLCNLRFAEGEIYEREKNQIREKSNELIDRLYKYLLDYYAIEEIEVVDYFGRGKETKKVSRSLNLFGFEIIDWGYLFLLFENRNKLSSFKIQFHKTLRFDAKKSIYDDQNKEQKDKLKIFAKSIFLAFSSIHVRKNELEIEQLPVRGTLRKLENFIGEISTQYSVDQLEDDRVNIFDENFYTYGEDKYYLSLRTLLFRSLNFLTEVKAGELIEDFFAHSVDIGCMLTAINILESEDLAKVVSKRISEIEIQEYIKSSRTVTVLQDTLIEAVNSESHWKLAKPLILRIQKHLEKVGREDDNLVFMLFNVDLLLAFKENDPEKIAEIEIPKSNYIINSKDNNRGEVLKKFFTGLHKLYNEKVYDVAISIFHSLSSSHDDEPRYAFHLYRAQTLKAIQDGDMDLLGAAFQQWEEFTKNLKESNSSKLSELSEAISSNKLHYYAHVNDQKKLAQHIGLLSKAYLHDEEIVPLIYNYYLGMKLHETAFAYLKKSIESIELKGKSVPLFLRELEKASVSTGLLGAFKNTLVNIRSIAATDLPSITPDIVNDKRNLNDFVFNELIQAAKVMTVKRDAVKKNPQEDRYNDLFLATLKLRFQVWGWSITDQPRTGKSPTGINAGEADITIEAGNIEIALLEGLILKGKEKSVVEKHIQKIFGYNNSLERYYMIIYFKGQPQKFDHTWESYKTDIADVDFEEKFKLDKNQLFIDLSKDYTDVAHLKLAKTYHGENGKIQIYHMMIDLSE